MSLPTIPKTHPLLEHAQLAMLRDCRQFVARKLRKERLAKKKRQRSCSPESWPMLRVQHAAIIA